MILSQGSETPAVPGPVAFCSPHVGPTIWLSQTCSESTCEEKNKQQVSELHSYSWSLGDLWEGDFLLQPIIPSPLPCKETVLGMGTRKPSLVPQSCSSQIIRIEDTVFSCFGLVWFGLYVCVCVFFSNLRQGQYDLELKLPLLWPGLGL